MSEREQVGVDRFAVILAGGSGTRLWPLSRRSRPKQLLRIVGGRSLLQLAYERLSPFLPAANIFVVALAQHREAVAAELPTLPAENFLGEPMGRDTANAIAFAAAILHRKNPDATLGVFTADNLIRPTEAFVDIVRRGFEVAEEHADSLVTFGIKPTHPHAGLGYVQRGDPVATGVWTVRSFKEKPAMATAAQFVSSGEYYWNSGMFVWRTGTILDQFARHLPRSHAAAQRIAAGWGTAEGGQIASREYPALTKISIDFAVMEKAPKVLVVEMALQWLDLGHWTALPAALGTDGSGTTRAARTASLASRNNIVVSEDDHLIATIGVEDLVIVHSADATLVCRRDQVDRIKELHAAVEGEHGGRYG